MAEKQYHARIKQTGFDGNLIVKYVLIHYLFKYANLSHYTEHCTRTFSIVAVIDKISNDIYKHYLNCHLSKKKMLQLSYRQSLNKL